MNKEELAAKLNGREYLNEITPAEERVAKESGLLVVFGASDDLCELRGAINDEVGAYEGVDILISDGQLLGDLEKEEIDILKKHHIYGHVLQMRAKALKIEAEWCAGSDPDTSWTYKTTTPHATFNVMEDGEVYCRGIVIDLKEVE